MENEVIKNIKDDIKEQAQLVIDQIEYEISMLHDDELAHYKAGLKKEQDTYLEKELNDLEVLAVTEASRQKMDTKRKLLSLREELVSQLFDDVKLLFNSAVVYQLDSEAGRNHGQAAQTPAFPRRSIFMRFFQGTQMTECPGYLVSVSFNVSFFSVFGSQHISDVACHAGFFGYANYHGLSFNTEQNYVKLPE